MLKSLLKLLFVVLLFLVIFVGQAKASNSFSDIGKSWAKNDIEFMKNIKLAGGYSNGTFKPDGHLTRAEAAVFLSRALGTKNAKGNFLDVKENYWAAGAIGALAEKKIIGGFSDGTYRPESNLTREQLASLLVRSYELKGTKETQFKDEVSKWAKTSVETLVANEITAGYPDGEFKGTRFVTRAEFMVFLKRTMEKTDNVPLVANPLIDDLDLYEETVKIKNYGNKELDLTGWKLVSVEGNQVFDFPDGFMLSKGSVVTITSGTTAKHAPPNFLKGWNTSVWLNSGDVAQLVDPNGKTIDELKK